MMEVQLVPNAINAFLILTLCVNYKYAIDFFSDHWKKKRLLMYIQNNHTLIEIVWFCCGMYFQAVVVQPHIKESSGFLCSLHVLSMSAWFLSGSSGFLSQSKDMHLVVGKSVWMHGLCLYVSLVMQWRPSVILPTCNCWWWIYASLLCRKTLFGPCKWKAWRLFQYYSRLFCFDFYPIRVKAKATFLF